MKRGRRLREGAFIPASDLAAIVSPFKGGITMTTFFARLLRRLFGGKNRLGALDQLEQEGHDRLVAERTHLRAHR